MPLSADVAPSHRTLAIAAGVVVADVALFVLITQNLLDGGGLISQDEVVLTWFVDHRTDWSISVAKLVSAIGSFGSLAVVAALLGVWLWRRGSHTMLAAAPLASLLLAGLASTVAKSIFDRDRPPVAVHATTVTVSAFPSGHATDAAAFFLAAGLTLALTVAHRRRTQLVLVATGVILAAVVGVARLVLGVHWLSDVVAGWALGSSIAITVVVGLWYLATHQAAALPRRDTAPRGP